MYIESNKVKNIIDEFKRSVPYIEGILVVSAEGLTIYSSLKYTDEEHIAAITATLVSLGINTTRSLNKGDLNSVFVKGADGYILLGEIKQSIVIAVVTREDVKIGVLLWELKKVKQKLIETFNLESY
ncbi:MAG: hypothetical protein EU549_01360 [Promethearchaeota archaeon]|nr:MAG: hypothetical protein EU549_01360 [Candidatus Lokiarchaeota archaeon]